MLHWYGATTTGLISIVEQCTGDSMRMLDTWSSIIQETCLCGGVLVTTLTLLSNTKMVQYFIIFKGVKVSNKRFNSQEKLISSKAKDIGSLTTLACELPTKTKSPTISGWDVMIIRIPVEDNTLNRRIMIWTVNMKIARWSLECDQEQNRKVPNQKK